MCVMSEKIAIVSPERLNTIEQTASILFIVGILVVFLSNNSEGLGTLSFTIGSGLIILGILGIFGVLLAKRQSWHTITERLMIVGMMVGVVGMFQANSILLYEYGFYVLGLCTLGFIIILHIPKPQTT